MANSTTKVQEAESIYARSIILYSQGCQLLNSSVTQQSLTKCERIIQDLKSNVARLKQLLDSTQFGFSKIQKCHTIVSRMCNDLQTRYNKALQSFTDQKQDEQNNKLGEDTRTNPFVNDLSITDPSQINTLGDFGSWLKNSLGGMSSDNPMYGSFLDALGQYNSNLANAQWQKESDDLAYSRTNPATLYMMYLSKGMSPVAAMQAAFGTSGGSVTGSSLGASMTTGFAAAQNNATQTQLAYDQLAQQEEIANEQNALQSESLSNQNMQFYDQLKQQKDQFEKQVELERADQKIKEEAMSMQRYSFEAMKHGKEVAAVCGSKIYGLRDYGIQIPETNLNSLTGIKDWAYGCKDKLNEIKNLLSSGQLIVMDNGWIVDTESYENLTCEEQDDFSRYLRPVITQQQLTELEQRDSIADEFRKCEGDPDAWDALQYYFAKNMDIRGFGGLQAELRIRQEKAEAEEIGLGLQKVMEVLENQDFSLQLNSEIVNSYREMDDAGRAEFEATIARAGYMIDDVTGLIYSGVQTDEQGNQTKIYPTAMDLSETSIYYIGMSKKEMLEARSIMQKLSTSTDERSYNMHRRNLILALQNGNYRLMLDNMSSGACLRWMKDTPGLETIAGLKYTFDYTGLGQAISAGWNAGVQTLDMSERIKQNRFANKIATENSARADRMSRRMTSHYNAAGDLVGRTTITDY